VPVAQSGTAKKLILEFFRLSPLLMETAAICTVGGLGAFLIWVSKIEHEEFRVSKYLALAPLAGASFDLAAIVLALLIRPIRWVVRNLLMAVNKLICHRPGGLTGSAHGFVATEATKPGATGT
jgi:hypothetical protein